MINIEETKKKITDILNEHQIELEIGGCGCCGSPWVTFKYKGETVIDAEDEFDFSNIKDQ